MLPLRLSNTYGCSMTVVIKYPHPLGKNNEYRSDWSDRLRGGIPFGGFVGSSVVRGNGPWTGIDGSSAGRSGALSRASICSPGQLWWGPRVPRIVCASPAKNGAASTMALPRIHATRSTRTRRLPRPRGRGRNTLQTHATPGRWPPTVSTSCVFDNHRSSGERRGVRTGITGRPFDLGGGKVRDRAHPAGGRCRRGVDSRMTVPGEGTPRNRRCPPQKKDRPPGTRQQCLFRGWRILAVTFVVAAADPSVRDPSEWPSQLTDCAAKCQGQRAGPGRPAANSSLRVCIRGRTIRPCRPTPGWPAGLTSSVTGAGDVDSAALLRAGCNRANHARATHPRFPELGLPAAPGCWAGAGCWQLQVRPPNGFGWVSHCSGSAAAGAAPTTHRSRER